MINCSSSYTQRRAEAHGQGELCLSLSSPLDVTGGDQPHSPGGHLPPWGHRKSYRYLWDLEWLGKKQVWENRGIRGWKRLVMCRQQMVTVLVWPCPMLYQRSLSFLIKFHLWPFSWVSGSLPLCTRVSEWQQLEWDQNSHRLCACGPPLEHARVSVSVRVTS